MDSIYTKIILTIIAVCLLVQTFDLSSSHLIKDANAQTNTQWECGHKEFRTRSYLEHAEFQSSHKFLEAALNKSNHETIAIQVYKNAQDKNQDYLFYCMK